MTDRDLSTLLKSAVEDPPTAIDTDQLLGTLGQSRTRRVHRVAAAAVVVAVVGIGVTWVVRPFDDRYGSSGSAGAGGQASTTADAEGECPPVIKSRTRAVDYADVLILSGQDYQNLQGPVRDVRLGAVVDTVGCSVREITEQWRWFVGPYPWPDRTATYLARGTELYTIDGVDPACQVAARVDGRTVVYTAHEPGAQSATPAC